MMRYLMLGSLLAFALPAFAQAPDADPSQPPGFAKYYFVLLTKGTQRDQDSATVNKLQAGHVGNVDRLAKAGKLVLAGPFLDDANWRGLFMLKATDLTEARALLDTDPMIKAGRLAYEVHPWMTQSVLEKAPRVPRPAKQPAPGGK